MNAANILRRAWDLVGRLGPFAVSQRPAAEEYTLCVVGTDAAQPAAWDGEIDLGEMPCYLSASTRLGSAPSRPAARHGLTRGPRGPQC